MSINIAKTVKPKYNNNNNNPSPVNILTCVYNPLWRILKLHSCNYKPKKVDHVENQTYKPKNGWKKLNCFATSCDKMKIL